MFTLQRLFRYEPAPSSARRLLGTVCTALFMASLSAAEAPSVRTRTVLNDGWFIKQIDRSKTDVAQLTRAARRPDSNWYPAAMPAQVQDVLLERGVIPDPRIGKNAAECSWVFEEDWVYATSFETPDGMGPVYLRFEGLDLRAAIYVNGHEVGLANNMYRRYSFDVRGVLSTDGRKNTLLVIFTGPVRELERVRREYKMVDGIAASKYLRKANGDFSDYLGAKPNFLKVGIFDEVALDVPGKAWLEHAGVRTQFGPEYSSAAVSVIWEPHGEPGRIRYRLYDPDGKLAAEGNGSSQEGSLEFEVRQPKLWWPHTHGEASMYLLELDVAVEGEIQDSQKIPFGFRRVEQLLFDESTGQARFGFKINGQLIFLKGAGWAPLEGMTQVWERERAIKQIDMGIQANMNLFRMWAGGNLPPQWFYDECDRRGVLVWQDIYHGYGMPPTHEAGFVENVEEEVEDMVKRLRNHPSIFLWTGGNETQMGWEFENGDRPMPGRELFEETIPGLIRSLDPTRPYHPSSPWGGPFANYPLAGDWHDYTTLKFVPLASVPLFGSEICRVSPPPVSSMRRYLSEEEIWPKGFEFRIDEPGEIAWPPMWQYRSAGSAWSKIGRIERFCDPGNAEELVRVLGTAHGEYLRERIERQRRGVPVGEPDGNRRSWGAMIWRLNDSWPMIYMSLIDYYLAPKIPYYFVKRAFDPVLVTFEQTPDRVFVWVVNDSTESVSGTLSLKKMDFSGTVLAETSTEVTLEPGESRRCLDETPLRSVVLRSQYLAAEFQGRTVPHLFEGERYLELPEPKLTVRTSRDGIEVSTDVFARQVTIEAPGVAGALFEDNYFDLLPGEKRSIRILDAAGASSVRIRAVNSNIVETGL